MVRIVKCEVSKNPNASVIEHYVQQGKKNAQIFQHLSEPETLRIIDLARIHIIHIINPSKSSRCLQEFVEAIHGTRRSVEVFWVASHPVCVEIRL